MLKFFFTNKYNMFDLIALTAYVSAVNNGVSPLVAIPLLCVATVFSAFMAMRQAL